MPEPPEDPSKKPTGAAGEPTRRDVLTRMGTTACVVAVAGSGVVTLDFLNPKVLFEPATTFRAGSLIDYPEGTVRFDRERKAYVVGGDRGVYAMSAVCTHLGCITRYVSDEGAIACPCHGSRFDLEGNVTHGPAPRPLPWLEVKLDEAGNLVVDTSVIIPRGKALKA